MYQCFVPHIVTSTYNNIRISKEIAVNILIRYVMMITNKKRKKILVKILVKNKVEEKVILGPSHLHFIQ